MNFKRYVEASDTWVDSHYIMGTSTDTITTLPADIYANDTTATVGLKGNTVQNGTPTPDNPVMPQGTGERTINLAWTGWAQDFVTRIGDSNNANIITDDGRTVLRMGVGAGSGDYDNKYIFKIDFEPNTQYTFSFYGKRPSTQTKNAVMCIQYTDDTVTDFTPENDGNYDYYTLVSAANKTIKYLRAKYTIGSVLIDIATFMVNKGASALPYEPYGYKIPISINNVVTDIYIGDNPLRKSLDGTAYDTLAADGTLTRRVDSDGSVLPTPIITQVTMPTFTTTPGANTLNVLTTVQPSEVTATFDGWHPVTAAHERSGGSWT